MAHVRQSRPDSGGKSPQNVLSCALFARKWAAVAGGMAVEELERPLEGIQRK